jgi:hypothetical protein
MIGIYIHIMESQNLGELKGGEASAISNNQGVLEGRSPSQK